MPNWWTETTDPVVGYTDALDTYACSSKCVWYVEVPELDYEGYFNVSDLRLINESEED